MLDATLRQAAYARDADLYDTRTHMFDGWRDRLVALLDVRPGDVVLDVGCGTGLCFARLQERVGPAGAVVGVDASPEMLGLAAARVREHGWRNVTLHRAAAEDVDLPGPVDHALFCAVHDVLQSDAALAGVLAHVRPGGSVVAGGGKWAPGWAVGVNMMVTALHAPYVHDFAGFERPWARLQRRLVGLRVTDLGLGGGYLAVGRTPPA